MKCPLGISNFLEEISSLSYSVVFLYFFAFIAEEGFLISPCYSLELCIQMLISFLFSFAFPHKNQYWLNISWITRNYKWWITPLPEKLYDYYSQALKQKQKTYFWKVKKIKKGDGRDPNRIHIQIGREGSPGELVRGGGIQNIFWFYFDRGLTSVSTENKEWPSPGLCRHWEQ